MSSKYIRVGGWGNQDWCRVVETGKQHQRPEEGGRPPFLRAKQRASISRKQENKTREEVGGCGVVMVVGRSEANTVFAQQRYCNGTRPILLHGLATPPGITSRWWEIQMLTEVSVYMKMLCSKHMIEYECRGIPYPFILLILSRQGNIQ